MSTCAISKTRVQDPDKTSQGYLFSQGVGRGLGQEDGGEVSGLRVLDGQLRGHLLVGHLDQLPQVFQHVVHAVLGDGLAVPVLQVLDVYDRRGEEGRHAMSQIVHTTAGNATGAKSVRYLLAYIYNTQFIMLNIQPILLE